MPDDIKKRKLSDDIPMTPKRSKAEKVLYSRREELADERGLDQVEVRLCSDIILLVHVA